MNPKLRGFLIRLPQSVVSALICIFALRNYPYVGFIPFYLLIVVLCIIAANEMAALMYHHARPNPNQRERTARAITIACGTVPALGAIMIVINQQWIPAFDFATALLFCMIMFIVHVGIMIVHIVSIERELTAGVVGTTPTTHTTTRLSTYYATALYIGLPAAILVTLTTYTIGAILMLGGIILTALFDTSSYACGVIFAKKVGIVTVSPRKSMAGYVGGAIITFVTMCTLIYRTEIIELSLVVSALIVLATIGAAIVGDLFESTLKRVAQKKDSGKLVAGRGGLLDSIDSHLVAIPTFCALCIWTL